MILLSVTTKWFRLMSQRELEVAEIEMLRFSLGGTRMDEIRNEFIRGTAHGRCFGEKVREVRLRWFGYVEKRESEYFSRRMMRLELPGRRTGGRTKRRFKDVEKEDMKLSGVREDDAEDHVGVSLHRAPAMASSNPITFFIT